MGDVRGHDEVDQERGDQADGEAEAAHQQRPVGLGRGALTLGDV